MTTKPKIALAVAGGGYRATLYSLGSLWRLNQFGLLPKLSTITSVSGGSILTAYLAMRWTDLVFNDQSQAVNFEEVIVAPLQEFCSVGIDVRAGISGLFSFRDTVGDKLAKQYDKRLYKGVKVASLFDEAPEFLFYGTNYQTGSSIRFRKAGISDYKIGEYPNPDILLANIVAVSSAFPPVFSPVRIKTDPAKWKKTEHATYFDNVKLKKNLILCDGGLYDNMGLEAVWKKSSQEGYDYVLVCDGGAPFEVNHRVRTNWGSQLFRMTDIMTDQQRALRKRGLIDRYKDIDEQGNHNIYGGTYWGLNTKIRNYRLPDAMVGDNSVTTSLKKVRTRLNAFSPKEQGLLVNWGYALTDAAIRKWVSGIVGEALNTKGQWPVPEFALDIWT